MRELLANILDESLRNMVYTQDYDGHVGLVDGDLSTLDLADDILEHFIVSPGVAHKGPHDTDAKFFRQVADRMEDPTKSINYLGGSNVRRAVQQLLYQVGEE